MAQVPKKDSPGFFSVLLGVPLKSEAPAGDDKNDSKATSSDQRSSKATSYDKEPRAPLRSSLTRDRTRSDPATDAQRRRAEPVGRRTKSDNRLSKPSPRSSSDQHFVDAPEARKSSERQARKVAFRTPTHSERNGKTGYPRLEQAGSSSESFHAPPPLPRPTPKAAKSRPKQARTSSKAEADERNWNSSTATLQDKEEARSRSSKSRSSKPSVYPLARPSQSDGYQAVRVSGPDRVIIVPTSTVDAVAQTNTRTVPAALMPGQRRPGPMPIVQAPPPTNRRLSQDRGQSRSRPPVEDQRSRSHRDRRSDNRADGQGSARPQGSRSNSRPDMGPPRGSTRTMPPMPDLPKATLLSQNMARARAGNRNPIDSYAGPPNGISQGARSMAPFQDRSPAPRMKAQQA
ncbi:hypothetical protein PSEUBRA_005289 [Kalmanozyma brasiliensis GHG001]|uniref:uncharacterized protein n=1 Tax=Kalmanozyma brasiliensis (strain GHG001) TaxID=1365824 RepID=UPI002867BBFF|nr:uncharacterized protein PSEUBRA_005289 [Kalmanozyma brasiliensis GHG001]KAF6767502.1 hypothetical protein PSEUBRA_005289 [Kalmanozyma brasiliensis GHG001]